MTTVSYQRSSAMAPVLRIVPESLGGFLPVETDTNRPDVPDEGQAPGHDYQTPPDMTTDSMSQPTSAIAPSSDHNNPKPKGFWIDHPHGPDYSNGGHPPGCDHQTPLGMITDSMAQPTSAIASSSDPENRMEGLEGVPNEPTLSGCEESGIKDVSDVLKQRSYYAKKRPVIKASIAITSCSELGVNGLLDRLNGTLGTSYTLKTLSESLRSALESCVDPDYDFGTTYARLRPYWFEDASRDIVKDERKDQDMRNQLLSDKKIIDGDAPPRRIWDLYANRVVPYWVVRKYPWAISHAWVDKDELTHVMTPINQNEWPVPIPQDANLDLIRIEMLNLGAEYVWLDVLCMRQWVRKEQEQEFCERGKDRCEKNELQLEESKVDMPTIGWVYQEADQVVCYFCGLGRPLRLTPGDLQVDKDRCWFNRAWTLQEINIAPIKGGITDDPEPNILDKRLEPLRFMRRVGFVFDILSKMQTRKSTKPLHRVAGLVYLFYSEYIPILYQQNEVQEEVQENAWTTLCGVTQDWFRADIFFLYPKPGDRKKFWRPSWDQLMAERETETLGRVLKGHHTNRIVGKIQRAETDKDVYWYEGPYIGSGQVQGLDDAPNAFALKKLRRGKLSLTDSTGTIHTFKIFANHTYPIPDGSYTLITNTVFPSAPLGCVWVVGETKGSDETLKEFQKLSVFSMEDNGPGTGARLQGLVEDRKVRLR